MLVAVILFPVKFTDNFPFNAHFDFEWAYGLAWAAMCFILTAAILFLISVDTKEIYHAERRLSLSRFSDKKKGEGDEQKQACLE